MSLNGQAHLLGEHTSDPKAALVIEAVLDQIAAPSGSNRSMMHLNQQFGFPDGRKVAINLGYVAGKESDGDPASWAAFPSNRGNIRVIGKAAPGEKIRIEITPAAKREESSSGKTYLLANGMVMAGNGWTLRVNYYEPIPVAGRRIQPVEGKKKAA